MLRCLEMQFLFKKYLEYEKSVGDKERIESVKTKAMEYVENTFCLINNPDEVPFQ